MLFALRTKPFTSSRQAAFTIVELLIVIVVIAILAGIAIVAYTGIQNRANDAAVKSDLAAIAKKYELRKVDDIEGYYINTPAKFQQLDIAVSKSAYLLTPDTAYNIMACVKDGGAGYAVAAISKSGKKFYVSSEEGVKEYTGTATWTETISYTSICSSILAGASYIGTGGHLYYQEWRPWAK